MSENKADPLREALEPFGAYADLIDRHCGHQPDGVSTVITEPFTIGHYRRARAALAAPQPAAPSKLASSERLGPHYDGTRSITRSLTPDGGGVTTPTPQPAAPLGGREALARMIRKALVENWRDDYDGRQWDEDVLLTGCRKVGGGIGYQKPEEAAQRLALDAADAILAIPQERAERAATIAARKIVSAELLYEALQQLVDYVIDGCPEGSYIAVIEAKAALANMQVVPKETGR